MASISTIWGLMNESELQKREGTVDNDNEHTTSVEYCLANCPGEAHRTNTPDASGHFCNQHVHRSAHVTLKKGLFAEGVAANFS